MQVSSNNEDFQGRHSESHLTPRLTSEEPRKLRSAGAPPAYGDEANSALAIPISRLSESSRSDGSFGDHGVFATTTTTHTVSTTTTFFRLPRRKNTKGPLFPLPPKVSTDHSAPSTPRISTGGRPSESPIRRSFAVPGEDTEIKSYLNSMGGQSSPTRRLIATSTMFAAPGSTIMRSDSSASHRSDTR